MPFAGFSDIAQCIAANGDKDDPAAFCASLEHETEKLAKRFAKGASKITPQPFGIAKVDEDQRLVYGYASVSVTKDGGELVDLQGDIIEPTELERAAHDYVLTSRAGHEMHGEQPVGDLVEAVYLSPQKLDAMGLVNKTAPQHALWVGFKLRDAETFAKVKSGEYKMFSIRGVAEEVEA